MIPVLLPNKKESGKFKRTLADEILHQFDRDLAIMFKDPVDGEVKSFPVWFLIERYIRITDTKGNFIPFELKREQIEMYKELCLLKRQGKPMFLDILKARQIGFSTLIAAIYVIVTLLVPNRKAVIVADVAKHARNIFQKYKFMYENLPQWMKNAIPLEKSNAFEVAVSYGNGMRSSITIETASDSTGRSDTANNLHLSEVAFWKVDIGDVVASLMQSVDTTDPNAIVIFETTANGYNGYKEIWDKDCAGETSFKPLFYPWFGDDRYSRPYTGFPLNETEKRLMKDYNLTYEQIAWYRAKLGELRGDDRKLRQEFPSSPVEAFLTTGHSLFSAELIALRKEEIFGQDYPRYEFAWGEKRYNETGEQLELNDIVLVKKDRGLITIFKDVEPRHPYIISVDPSNGGSDSFVAQVFDNYAFEQVAILSISECTDFEWIGLQICCLVKHYNNALLNAETNNTTGTYVLELAKKLGHTLIYQDNSVETLSDRYEDKFGYKIKTTNREYLIALLTIAFKDKYRFVNDYGTLCEMENFQIVRNERTGKEKSEATNGAHDDRVTALFGVFLARRSMEQTTFLLEESPSDKKVYVDPENFYRKPKEKSKGIFIQWK